MLDETTQGTIRKVAREWRRINKRICTLASLERKATGQQRH